MEQRFLGVDQGQEEDLLSRLREARRSWCGLGAGRDHVPGRPSGSYMPRRHHLEMSLENPWRFRTILSPVFHTPP